MAKVKYATIDIEGESNVGVIRIGDLTDVHKDDVMSYFTKNVEPALVEALKAHFDCPVKVSVPMLEVKTYYPLTVEYRMTLETEDEDKYVNVVLNETWVYSV